MSDNYQQPQFDVSAMTRALAEASPLQASRVLIDMELFEQRDSLTVLNGIYKEFESSQSIMDELVQPIALNLLDGIVSHRQLRLDRTGLSASRLWEEVQIFDYDSRNRHVAEAPVSQKQQLEGMRTPRDYDKNVRKTMTKRKNLEANKDRHFKGNKQAYSAVEFNDDGSRITVYRKQAVAENKGHKWKAADTDHVIPVKQINDQFAKNAFLTDVDLRAITDGDHNLIEISNSLNRAKGAKSFSEMHAAKQELQKKADSGERLSPSEKNQLKNLSRHSEKTYEEAIKKEQQAASEVLKNAQQNALKNIKGAKLEVTKKVGKQAGEQTAYQAIGHAILLFIKPLLFEMNDAIRNGFGKGVDKASTIEGLKFRFTRMMVYVRREILPTLAQAVKDLVKNIFKVIIQGVLDLVTGMFRSVMRIISEGFSAMVGAIKILGRPASEMSGAQKADAIVKLIAATAVTFTIFTFENTLLKGPLAAMPEFVKDIALATLSGIASTIVVYLLDKADLFSVKAELRSKRVEEIFNYRIEQIKLNTDAFTGESIRKLAEDRLRFKAISERINAAIKVDADVNPSVYALADHFKIKLDIRDTNEFLNLLKHSDALVV